MILKHGKAEEELWKINPKYIITDAPKHMLDWLINYAEEHDCILINAYSRLWIHAGDHLTPGRKHVEPYAKIIETFVPENNTVCDPFMGSGSIGVAAIGCGRDFIGIETIRSRFDAACERLYAAKDAKTRQNRE